MKIKNTFVLRNIAGSNTVVPLGSEMMDFNGMITLNETGAFLWQHMLENTTVSALADALMSEYEGISRAEAESDINEFIETLKSKGILENE